MPEDKVSVMLDKKQLRLYAEAPNLVSALRKCASVLSGEALSKKELIEALEAARDVLAKVKETGA